MRNKVGIITLSWYFSVGLTVSSREKHISIHLLGNKHIYIYNILYLYIYLCVSFAGCVGGTINSFSHPSINQSIHPSVCLSVCSSICPSPSLSLCPSIHPSSNHHIHPTIHPFNHPSNISQSVYPWYIVLSVHPSINHPSIHLPAPPFLPLSNHLPNQSIHPTCWVPTVYFTFLSIRWSSWPSSLV